MAQKADVKKFVVLLSGGLDSTLNLYESIDQGQVELALTFNYGQKAASREIEVCKKFCRELGVAHKVIDLPWFQDFTFSSLVDAGKSPPIGLAVKIDDLETSLQTAKNVWVPNRNGIFLNIGAGFAEGLGAGYVVVGFNAEEAQTFPDNSLAYLEQTNKSFAYSTANKTQAVSFTTNLNKTQMVLRASELNIPLENVWPCYFSGETLCGHCESCQRFNRAVKDAKIKMTGRRSTSLDTRL